MKRRDSILLTVLVMLCVSAGLVLVLAGPGGRSGPTPIGSGEPVALVEPEPVPAEDAPPVETVARPDAPAERAASNAVSGPAPKRGGVIDGQLLLTPEVAGTFGEYTIGLTEMINPNSLDDGEAPPRTVFKTFKVLDNSSPQYFAWYDIPYSRHGYEVRAYIDGLNGSHQVIRMTEQDWNPQVRLTVTRGAAFVLRLIDLERFPWVDQPVTLRPVPGHFGLPMLDAVTDGYGSAAFDSVLAGEYEVLVGGRSHETVTVRPRGFVHDDAGVGVQSKLIRIPRGKPFTVEVFGASWAIPDVALTLFRVDTSDNVRFEQRTDQNGICTFENVPAGRYHLQLRAALHQPTDRAIRIEADRGPEPYTVRMARLR